MAAYFTMSKCIKKPVMRQWCVTFHTPHSSNAFQMTMTMAMLAFMRVKYKRLLYIKMCMLPIMPWRCGVGVCSNTPHVVLCTMFLNESWGEQSSISVVFECLLELFPVIQAGGLFQPNLDHEVEEQHDGFTTYG
jgi:hypothetical protein